MPYEWTHDPIDTPMPLKGHTHYVILDYANHIFEGSPVGMGHWNAHVWSELAADRPENRPPIQIKPVHSSVPYQQATLQKYDRRCYESPSGYGPLWATQIQPLEFDSMPYGFAQDPSNTSNALMSNTYSHSTSIVYPMGGPKIPSTLLMPLMHEQDLQPLDINCMPYGGAQDSQTLLMPLMSNPYSAIRIWFYALWVCPRSCQHFWCPKERHLQSFNINCMPYEWAQDPTTRLMPLMSNTN